MAFSLRTSASRDQARAKYKADLAAQSADQNYDKNRAVMNKIAEFAADVAEIAPNGTTSVTLIAAGGVDMEGHGSFLVALSF